jgi:small subunit ribosomal protein S18
MGFRPRRRKVCFFCTSHIDEIDYKDVRTLNRYVSDRGKILPRRVSGACAKHQRKITSAVKRARAVALMPYVAR